MDDSETHVILGTQDTEQINVRENRRGNQKWTIQRHWQHWAHKTQDKGWRKPKGWLKMDDSETHVILGTQDTGQRQVNKTQPNTEN